MWEDERNRQGGRWLVNTQKNFRQQELDRLWVETVRSFLFFKNIVRTSNVVLATGVIWGKYKE